MSKFSLANASAGTKRSAGGQATGGPAKIPKVSMLTKEPAREPTQRVTTSGPLKICVYKYTDKAADVWSQFKDVDDAACYQVQVEHDARL